MSTRASGSFYGYKLHQIVCAITGLPLAWRVETAKAQESTFAVPLLESVKARGFRPEIAVMDMGYDHTPVYDGFEARDCHPSRGAVASPGRGGRPGTRRARRSARGSPPGRGGAGRPPGRTRAGSAGRTLAPCSAPASR